MAYRQLAKIILILLGVLILMVGCSKQEVEEVFYDNRLIINREEDFNKGEKENIKLNNEGEIVLDKLATEGKYISPILKTKAFKDLVMSWNIDTPHRTEIEVLVKVKLGEKWSRWFSYGKWSTSGNRGSVRNQADEIAKMSIDTLEVLGENGGDSIKYSIILSREDTSIPSPRVRNIFVALNLVEEARPVLALDKTYLVDLEVPERSQMLVPEIGNVICSPTSLSMVLEYYGYKMDTEEVAANVLDKEFNIYGNWSFNAAYGGTKCKYSYIERCSSVDDIKEKISKGIPLIASIKTKTEDAITGAPQAYPSGHLIVVRGFTIKDGEEYVIVNDPAAKEVESVRREYKLSEFEKAWNRIIYVLVGELD